MSYFDDFTDTFADIIEGELTDTLSQELSFDFARRAAKEIVDAIDREHRSALHVDRPRDRRTRNTTSVQDFRRGGAGDQGGMYKHCLISVLLVNP